LTCSACSPNSKPTCIAKAKAEGVCKGRTASIDAAGVHELKVQGASTGF
jgi:hypothetical protein